MRTLHFYIAPPDATILTRSSPVVKGKVFAQCFRVVTRGWHISLDIVGRVCYVAQTNAKEGRVKDYPAMMDVGITNYPIDYPVCPDEVRNIARAVLSRAIQDIRNTKDYANCNGFGSKAFTSQAEMCEVGEEVRDWLLCSTEHEVFGFENVCRMSGYDARKVMEYLKKNDWIVPKNQYLAEHGEAYNAVLQEIRANPGIAHTYLVKRMRGKYPTTTLRRAYTKLEASGAARRYRYNMRTKTEEGVQRWYEDKAARKGCAGPIPDIQHSQVD